MKLPEFRFQKEYFIFLLPVFFVIHGFTENFYLVPVKDALGLIIYYILCIAIVSLLMFLFFRSWRKATIFTGLIFAFHFFFGSLHDLSKNIWGDSFFTSYKFILIISFIAFIVFLFFILKTNRQLQKVVNYWNFLLLILIFLDGAILFKKIFNNTNKSPQSNNYVLKCDTCKKPDIYLIIADEYAGHQELQEVFNYNNEEFENNLKNRGFYLLQNIRSNYNFTPFSVASILNFSYLPLKNPNNAAPETSMVMDLIKNNQLQQFLYLSGYKIYNNSFFDLAGLPTESIETFLPTKTKFITAQTFISRLKRDIFFNLITKFHIQWIIKNSMYYNQHNNELLYDNTIKTSILNQYPKFSYTHLMLPHYPFYYDRNGTPNSYNSIFNDTDKNKYLSYLQYANKKYLNLIDAIFKNSVNPPIIIFMSDHGFRESGDTAKRKYMFMNICAVYYPNENYDYLKKVKSNVNLFRSILNTQFSQKLTMLLDSSIFLTD